jgi:poly(A) polymerase
MQRAARRIVKKLRLHGHEAFFAGGWVRDFLLRRKPKDIDIATSALPQEVLRLFAHSNAIGAKFGVIQVRMYGHAYEVATFRSDSIYSDGRHPSSVTYSGPEQDALRRDFTINGLFYDPVAERLIDYVHGRADIQNRLIRSIGNPVERFAEDKLRMLRAVRLACGLGFQIVPETWNAIQNLASEILQVSWERIRDELFKLLTGPAPDRGLDLLHESGLLSHILPEVDALCEIPESAEFPSGPKIFARVRARVASLRKPSAVLALAALINDLEQSPVAGKSEQIGGEEQRNVIKEKGEEICRRLRMSNEEVVQVIDLVASYDKFFEIKEMKESTLKKFLRKPNFPDHLELHRVICLSFRKDLDIYKFCVQKIQEYGHELTLPLLLKGEDLIEMGYKPGPMFKEILQTVEDLQLEGTLRTREEALEHVKRLFPLKNSIPP